MADDRTWEVWVGAYAEETQVGITRLELNGQTGELGKTAEYGGIENPSFLALGCGGKVLYAASETAEVEGQPGGRMIAYPVETGTRKLLSGWERLTHGAAPCHVSLDSAGQWLAVANYNGAAVTLYTLEPDGKPSDAVVRLRHAGSGPNPARQEAPHPHSAYFDPADGRCLYVPDLGLDRVMIYEKGEDGTDWTSIGAASLALGDGPRHLAIHPADEQVYVVNELASSVTRFIRRGPGKLERQETVSTLPSNFQGESWCAEIVVSPDGRFVYASNRGHDSIAVFRVEAGTASASPHIGTNGPDTSEFAPLMNTGIESIGATSPGSLIPAGHVSTRGRTPRNFAITPDGAWMIAANQDTDNLVVFRMDAASGLPIYHGVEVSVGKPVCVRIAAMGGN